MKVNCGGGHRSWGVVHTQDQTTFAYIKTKKVVIYSTGKDYSGHVLLKVKIDQDGVETNPKII